MGSFPPPFVCPSSSSSESALCLKFLLPLRRRSSLLLHGTPIHLCFSRWGWAVWIGHPASFVGRRQPEASRCPFWIPQIAPKASLRLGSHYGISPPVCSSAWSSSWLTQLLSAAVGPSCCLFRAHPCTLQSSFGILSLKHNPTHFFLFV